MITGSHNPKDDNGFKMLAHGRQFYDYQLQNLYGIIINYKWNNLPNQEIKSITHKSNKLKLLDITDQYINRILQKITIDPSLKVAWDPANGAASTITELLKARLPNKNWVINSQIDGNFSAHHPNPTIPNNLTQLIQLVQAKNCDIGIGFDGDADRLGVISKSGRIILAEQIFCILAKDVLYNHHNATIIMDITTSETIFQKIKSYGGNPIMWKTGHPYIKDKIHETKALLAGETSGHLFFADRYYGYDDGIYVALRLLDLLSNYKKSLDELIDELPKSYAPVEIKIPVKDEIKFHLIAQIKQKLIERNIVFKAIDGIRVSTNDGWWVLRASNTEGKIIAKYQLNSAEGANNLITELKNLLNLVNVNIT